MSRARAQAHAKRGYYCECGRIVHGNGARAMHFYIGGDRDQGRRDGHREVSAAVYDHLFPDRNTYEWVRRAFGKREADRWAAMRRPGDTSACERCGGEGDVADDPDERYRRMVCPECGGSGKRGEA